MKKPSIIDWSAIALTVIGGVNWGLVGAFEVDLVATLFGDMSTAARVVYIVIGVASLWMVYTVSKLVGEEGHVDAAPGDLGDDEPHI